MRTLFLPFVALAFAACTSGEQQASYSVIPLPQEVSLTQAEPFKLNKGSVIAYPADNALLKRNAEFLSEYIAQSTGYNLPIKGIAEGESVNKAITLALSPDIANKEGYELTTTADGVRIAGQTENGVFYGIQTLRKSIPAVAQEATILLPAGEVKDEPRFAYRGMHLDVGRHFFPLDFVKKYIDLLALHNMNTFHWHLTEDQGWRIEIKKYPRLTEIGSVRNRTVIGKNTEEYDETPYGGFYTQEEAREIVKYAAERYITVIPEVDLPGHMLAALAAYPELGCTGGPYEVCPRWGVFEDVLCIGNEKTIPFLEDVLTEILDIFPSKYIHIGGDEAPRTRWEKCPKCQALIRQKGLKSDKEHTAEDRLQSYCMTTIEQFLNSKGRQIIGWDEILEGDVAPNATVMSWRGSAGGIKAAQMGHDVIMTPNSHCYFDYYQSSHTENEPLSIGGYLPIEKVYSLEPTESLNDEQKKHIIGVQANLWTEYIASTEHVEYMVLPRMDALAEVQWTRPEKKDYKDFTSRLLPLLKFYQRDSLNYSKQVFDLKADFTPDTLKKVITVSLSAIDDAPIYYTLDGSTPTTASTLYTAPIDITTTVDFCAAAIRPEGPSNVTEQKLFFNKATMKPITLATPPVPRYAYNGAPALVDGIKGKESYFSSAWLGFYYGDLTATIDLREPTDIQRVFTSACVDLPNWIMGCTGLVVSVSDDGKNFRQVADKSYPAETSIGKRGIEDYEVTFEPTKARYVKVVVKHSPALPKGHDGAGRRPYIFVDEIGIE
ncbi:MAG: family 20 glycosylhydrolase [Bacteroides sp.]|nr:family 20 glycosylhydrolase [Bacteroides sp.]